MQAISLGMLCVISSVLRSLIDASRLQFLQLGLHAWCLVEVSRDVVFIFISTTGHASLQLGGLVKWQLLSSSIRSCFMKHPRCKVIRRRWHVKCFAFAFTLIFYCLLLLAMSVVQRAFSFFIIETRATCFTTCEMFERNIFPNKSL